MTRRVRFAMPGVVTRVVAAIGVGAIALGGLLAITDAPAFAADGVDVNDIDLSWQMNDEVGGGAYFGGCNFLSAGAAGNSGSSRLWTEADGFYKSSEGDVTITKPDSSGAQVAPTWSTKCQNGAGTAVTPAAESTTANRVNFANGTGTIDADADTGSIAWDGSFTIVFYGGLTYWTVSDVRLDVVNGTGTLRGTASGYGADMYDTSKWVELAPTTIDLATFSDVDLGTEGFTIEPDYAGVEVSVSGTPQVKTGENFGSFPQSFVTFNELTGQSSYWYSSGGAADPKKHAEPITVGAVPTATPDHTRIPQGFTTLGIGFTGLGDASGEVRLSTNGVPLEASEASEATVTAGKARGAWNVSGLALGWHELIVEVGSGNAWARVDIAPIRIEVVPPLGKATPTLGTPSTTSDSLTIGWSWTHTNAGPPTDYVVRVYAGTTATGTPVGERVSTEPSYTLGGLQPDQAYTVTVTPRIAGLGDEHATLTTRTVPATTPAPTPTPTPTEDPGGTDAGGATFYWGLNKESTSGAFYGGCNFLAAGPGPVRTASGVWNESEYRSADGAVTIIKPNGNTFEQANWSNKCADRGGVPVSTQRQGSYSESQVRITDGEVTKASDGSLRVQWRGSFTVAFYGGLAYWTATDPLLVVDAAGSGRVTATGSGYGASMQDASKWVKLDERTITLANLGGIDAATVERESGFALTPDYLGVSYTGTGSSQGVVGSGDGTATGQAPRTAANGSYWGSFPSDFVDFQNETGLFSYWFTSGGARDVYKPTLPMTVSLDGTGAPEVGTYSASTPPLLDRSQPGGTNTGAGAAPPQAPTAGDAANGASGNDAASTQALADGGIDLTRGPIHPGLLVAGGAGLVGVAGLNWAVGMLIRRRLGLDPTMFG